METFKRFSGSDSEEVVSLLKRDRTHAIIMLYDILNFGMDPGDTPFHGEYFGRRDDGELKAVCAAYGLGSLFVFSPEPVCLAGAGEYIESRELSPGILIGEQNQIEVVMKELAAGSFIEINRYRTDSMELYTSRDGIPHLDEVELADMSMVEELVDLAIKFEVEQFGESDTSRETAASMVERHIQDGLAFILRKDGRIVSKADGLLVEGIGGQVIRVYSDPGQRSKGYATACVGALSLKMLEKCDAVYLEVLDHNTPAIKAYSNLGYRKNGNRLFVQVVRS